MFSFLSEGFNNSAVELFASAKSTFLLQKKRRLLQGGGFEPPEA